MNGIIALHKVQVLLKMILKSGSDLTCNELIVLIAMQKKPINITDLFREIIINSSTVARVLSSLIAQRSVVKLPTGCQIAPKGLI